MICMVFIIKSILSMVVREFQMICFAIRYTKIQTLPSNLVPSQLGEYGDLSLTKIIWDHLGDGLRLYSLLAFTSGFARPRPILFCTKILQRFRLKTLQTNKLSFTFIILGLVSKYITSFSFRINSSFCLAALLKLCSSLAISRAMRRWMSLICKYATKD